MAGFLTSAGTALGGFNQGYDNAQQAALKRILGQLALQQEQRKIQGARLGGMGLMQGVPGLSPAGMGGMPGGAAMPQPQPPPPIPSAPTLPGQPDATAMPAIGQGMPTGNPGAAPIDVDELRPPARAPNEAPIPPRAGLTDTLPGAPINQPPVEAGPVETETPPALPSTASLAAPSAGGDAAGGGTDKYAWVSGLFRQIDPNAIAKRLSELDPSATPDVVLDATQQLMKLAEGDRSGQYQAAVIAKLMGFDAAQERVVTQQAGAKDRVVTQQAGANQRTQMRGDQSKAVQDRIDARFAQSMGQRQMSAAQKQQAQSVANSYKAVMAQISALKGQFGMLGPQTPADQAKYKQLAAQAASIWSQASALGLALPPPADLLK